MNKTLGIEGVPGLHEVTPTQRSSDIRLELVRVAHVRKINELEDAGHWSDAARARDTLAVITETRDALRLRFKVFAEVEATQTRRVSQIRGSVFFPEYK